jgi:beta-glucosidase
MKVLMYFFKLIVTLLFHLFVYAQEWDWTKINTDEIKVDKSFLWGAAICEYQNSGADHCDKSNWAHWETTTFPDGSPHIIHNQKSGSACDHWNRYPEDIKLMQELGLNSLRFSVDWSKIQPQEGTFNEQALQHYAERCDALIEAGIKPLITLHHFTHPQWFEEKGGFEKEENIQYFVEFCKKVFEALSSKVELWCTINEPTVYVFQGYIRGVFPPGKSGRLGLIPTSAAAQVLQNLMKAHVDVYTALKAMPGGDKAQIGLVHQYLQFVPYSWWHLAEKLPGFMLNHFLNDSVVNFCATGKFTYTFSIPWVLNIQAEYQAPTEKFLDFIGLNYYSRVLVTLRPGHGSSSCYPHEIMTDMPYAMYPQGLYDAIKDMARLKVPIYITENGIADEKDDRREAFIKQYLYALSRALQEGYDVRGFYYWSLMDNFEWDMGTTMKFGLYKVDFATQERKLRDGARHYASIIQKNKDVPHLKGDSQKTISEK